MLKARRNKMMGMTGGEYYYNNLIARSDQRSLFLSILFFAISINIFLFSMAFSANSIYVNCFILALYIFLIAGFSRCFCDPVLIFSIVLLQYSWFPTFVAPENSRFLLLFGSEGATRIHSFAIVCFFCANALAIYLIKLKKSGSNVAGGFVEQKVLFHIASMVGALFSIFLSMIYIAQRGSVLGGDVSYADSFTDRLEAGSGILLLAAPLANAAFAFCCMNREKFRSPAFWLCLLAFGLLFFAYGQRKYFLMPVIIYVAFYTRWASPRHMLTAFIAAVVFYFVFLYVGYLRIYDISLGQAINSSIFDAFLGEVDVHIAGETPPLYATASAAYDGLMQPLPWLGDYTQSWKMSVPQFLGVGGSFVSANVRFAYLVDPVTAALGAGWGFSYWGEAYMVLGYFGVFLASIFAIFLFRYVYSRAGGARLNGLGGVFSLCSLYYALWIHRNAFAYTFKEFIIYQAAVIFLLYFGSSVVFKLFHTRKKRSVNFG